MDSELHVDANTCPDTSTDTNNESSFGNSGLDSADLDSDNADSDSEQSVFHGRPLFGLMRYFSPVARLP